MANLWEQLKAIGEVAAKTNPVLVFTIPPQLFTHGQKYMWIQRHNPSFQQKGKQQLKL